MDEPEKTPATAWPLTRREWIVLAKLVAIVAMTAVLVQVRLTFDYDIEQFIYGRF